MIGLPVPIEVLGVGIHPVSVDQLLEILTSWASLSETRRAQYVNVHALNLAWEESAFRDAINSADLVYCDGHGVKLGATFLGRFLPERMTPPDWINPFLTRLAALSIPIFLLGDEPGVGEACSERMSEDHPGILIAGNHHGFFGFPGKDDDAVVKLINGSGAGVVLVGMGMPRQEFWLMQNLSRLSASLVLPVGALFRFHAGIERRGPKWLTDSGFEWVFRLAQHPVMHFRRYLVGIPKFVARLGFQVLEERRGDA